MSDDGLRDPRRWDEPDVGALITVHVGHDEPRGTTGIYLGRTVLLCILLPISTRVQSINQRFYNRPWLILPIGFEWASLSSGAIDNP